MQPSMDPQVKANFVKKKKSLHRVCLNTSKTDEATRTQLHTPMLLSDQYLARKIIFCCCCYLRARN